MLAGADIDALSEVVLASLLADGACVAIATRAMVAEAALRAPQAPALSLVLPLSMAAAAIETMLADPAARRLAEQTWRMAALLATEILDLQNRAGAGTVPDIAALRLHLARDPACLGGVVLPDRSAPAA